MVEARRVLIVDDDIDFSDSLHDILEVENYLTQIANNTHEALLSAQTFNPHVTLLDVRLGQASGLDLLIELRRQDPQLLCIIMTAYANVETAIRALQYGAYDYLRKPVYPAELIATLYRCFEKIELEQKNRHALAALQASEERYRSIFENALEGIFRYKPEEGFIDANPALIQMLGYDCKEDVLALQLKRDVFVKEEQFQYVRSQIQAREIIKNVELLWQKKNGEHIIINLNNQVIQDDQGEFLVCESMVQDITERKQAEKTLRESEQTLQLILNHFPIRVFWKDKALNFMGCNQLHAEDRGLSSPDEIIGKNDYDFFSVEEAELYRADDREVINLGKAKLNFEEPQTRFDGAPRWLRTSKVPLHDADDNVIGMLGTYEDITNQKQVEADIHRQNRELNLLNRVIAATATSPDTNTMLNTVCRELALAFDTPQATAILLQEECATATFVADYHPKEQSTLLHKSISLENNGFIQYLLTAKVPLLATEAQDDARLAPIHDLLHKRNTISLLALPLMAEQEIVGCLTISTTQPRTFSEEEISLAQSVAEQVSGTLLRIRLDEQHRQLEDQLRQSQKMEAIGRLAGGMAHDFNNLLTVISGYSELLLKRHMDKNDRQYRDVEQIHKASERASTLTRQLLAFSRQQVIQPEVLDLNDIISDLNKMLRRLVSEDIDLITNLDPLVGRIRADSGQIEQVIMNLVVNAADAMPQGGKLTIQTANTDVDADYARRHVGLSPGAYVVLSVIDTGAGMDPETLSHIYEPFFTTKEKDKGTGLGLATVYGIVQQNEGYISATSQLNQGTAFQIYLPRLEQAPQFTPQNQRPTESQQGTETILLVEDEDMVRELARQSLYRDGYKILEAHNGQEALYIAQQLQQPIHLLLTDMVMPGGLNGQELAQQLKTVHPETKVLFMSGYIDDEIAQRGIFGSDAALDAAFLQKPFSLVTLSLRVRAILDT